MLGVLTRQRLSRGVVDGLLDAINVGEFAPGDRLPSERTLAENFGVSRPSVREGLRILELMEAVEVRHGHGAIVLEGALRPSGRPLRSWLRSHQEEVLELLDVRATLEASAAAAAAMRPSSDGDMIAPMIDGDELEAHVAADVAFHAAVASRSGNAILTALVHELNGVLHASRYAMFAIPGRPERSQRDHARIARAINVGDAASASRSMRRHIERARKEIEMADARTNR